MKSRRLLAALAAGAVTLLLAACASDAPDASPIESSPPAGSTAPPPAAEAPPAAPQPTVAVTPIEELDGPDLPSPDVIGPSELVEVEFVLDGGTIELTDGRRVRLVQIDTPEGGESEECYADEAREALREWVPSGAEVTLVADPFLDQEDRFGRLLRYVYVGSTNVNLELVRDGAATVWFVGGDQGALAEELLRAGMAARDEGRGLWGACPGTPFETRVGAETGPA